MEEIRVPAREGRAFRVAAGGRLRITSVEGDQACDFFAFVDGSPREFLSTACTRWPAAEILPREGTVFVSNLRRPLLTFLEDGAGGMHDMLLPACSRERYREGWGLEDHPNCRENCVRAVSELFELPYEYVPEPINFFTDFRVTADGALRARPVADPSRRLRRPARGAGPGRGRLGLPVRHRRPPECRADYRPPGSDRARVALPDLVGPNLRGTRSDFRVRTDAPRSSA